jgi:Transposase DDE domain
MAPDHALGTLEEPYNNYSFPTALMLVDTEGFVLKVRIHSAKVMDHEGIKTILEGADQAFPRLRQLWVDAGYRGEDKGADWVEKTLGWSVDGGASEKARPRRGAEGMGEGMGQGGRGARLAETIAPQRLSGVAEEWDIKI